MFFYHYDKNGVEKILQNSSSVYIDDWNNELEGPVKLNHIEVKPGRKEGTYKLKMSTDGFFVSRYNLDVTESKIVASKPLRYLEILEVIAWFILLIYTIVCGIMISDLYDGYTVEPGDYQILAALCIGLFVSAFIYHKWSTSTMKTAIFFINKYIISKVNLVPPVPQYYTYDNSQSALDNGFDRESLNELDKEVSEAAEESDIELAYETDIAIDAGINFAMLMPNGKYCEYFLGKKNLSEPVMGLREAINRDLISDEEDEEDEEENTEEKKEQHLFLINDLKPFSLKPLGNDLINALTSTLNYTRSDKVAYLRDWAEDFYKSVEDKIGRPYFYYTTDKPFSEEQKKVLGSFCYVKTIENMFVAEYPEYLLYILIYDDKTEYICYESAM